MSGSLVTTNEVSGFERRVEAKTIARLVSPSFKGRAHVRMVFVVGLPHLAANMSPSTRLLLLALSATLPAAYGNFACSQSSATALSSSNATSVSPDAPGFLSILSGGRKKSDKPPQNDLTRRQNLQCPDNFGCFSSTASGQLGCLNVDSGDFQLPNGQCGNARQNSRFNCNDRDQNGQNNGPKPDAGQDPAQQPPGDAGQAGSSSVGKGNGKPGPETAASAVSAATSAAATTQTTQQSGQPRRQTATSSATQSSASGKFTLLGTPTGGVSSPSVATTPAGNAFVSGQLSGGRRLVPSGVWAVLSCVSGGIAVVAASMILGGDV